VSGTAIRTAIIPAAGLGTRLYPLTLGTAKELLPLGRHPALVACLLEAAAAEVRELCVVSSPEKEGLGRFLSRYAMPAAFAVRIALQPEPAGVLDAVERGLSAAAAMETAVAVLFPDLVHLPDQTALAQLCAAHAACGGAVFGLRIAAPGEPLASSAAVRLRETPEQLAEARASGRPLRIFGVGPATGAAGEILTTFGQIHTPSLGAAIAAHCRPSVEGPLQDARFVMALDALAAAGGLFGVLLSGEVLDLGSLPGYLAASGRFLSGTARLRGLP